MITRAAVTIAMLVSTTIATAQPAAQPYAPQPYPQPNPQPQPYPQPYAPAPYAYQPQQLTAEEYELLAEGEISEGAHYGGAALSFFFGLGAGQAVQGRWGETGWIFTLGEIGAAGLLFYGVA